MNTSINNNSELDNIRYNCYKYLKAASNEIRLKYVNLLNDKTELTMNDWVNLENMLKNDVKKFAF